MGSGLMQDMRTMDTDGDQKVSLTEIDAQVSRGDEDQTAGDKMFREDDAHILHEVFPQSDRDGDGLLDMEELKDMMQKFDEEREKAETEEHVPSLEQENMAMSDEQSTMKEMHAFDADGDQKVSLAEIEALLMKKDEDMTEGEDRLFPQSDMAAFSKVFPESDKDQDGSLDKTEFADMMRRFG